jgi:hypothetical protein
VLTGTCPLPDETNVKVGVRRSVDVLRGDHIVAQDENAGAGICEVEKHRFTLDLAVNGSGRYSVLVTIPWDLQEKHLLEELKRKVASERTWSFMFEVPGDARLAQSAKRLSDFAALVESAFDLVVGYESATMSEERWNQDKDGLVARCNALMRRPANPDLYLYFPLAVRSLDRMFRYLEVNSERFAFREGRFTGLKGKPVQPLAGGPFLIDRNENSPWDGFKRFAKESRSIAAREFCLGVVGCLRASEGVLNPEIAAALEAAKEAPGVRPWAARLRMAAPADLEKLEGEIRDLRIDPVQ